MISNSSFAQSKSKSSKPQLTQPVANATVDPQAQKLTEALKKLAALQPYGNTKVGRYPLCSDVINVYPQKVDYVAYQSRKKGNSETPPSDNEYTPVYAEVSRGSGLVSGGACFTDATIVTIAFPNISDGIGAEEISMVNLAEKFEDNETEGLHILSSIIEAFPDASGEFLKPCWGKVEGHTLGELHDEKDQICTITYGNNHQETCTPKHRFRVEICDNAGKRTGCEWKAVSEINPTTMNLLSDNNTPVKISSITPPKEIEDVWGWPDVDFDILSDLDVHNLTISTGTYYVGAQGNRVLVHNLKP